MENTKTVPTNGRVCVKPPKGKKGGVTTEAMKKYGRNMARVKNQEGS